MDGFQLSDRDPDWLDVQATVRWLPGDPVPVAATGISQVDPSRLVVADPD